MLIKRLVSNIKKQDWFSVLLELAIVILGIYLGFQVTDWQARQQAKVAESKLLMRLSEDLTNLELQNRRVSDKLSKQLQQVEQALEFVRNPQSWKQDYNRWQKYLRPMLGYEDPVVELPVYEEIVATAQLGNIGDQSFRTALTRFSHQLDITNQANKAFTSMYTPAYRSIFHHLVDLQEFPLEIKFDSDRKIHLIRNLHTTRKTITSVQFFTNTIAAQAVELNRHLNQIKLTRSSTD